MKQVSVDEPFTRVNGLLSHQHRPSGKLILHTCQVEWMIMATPQERREYNRSLRKQRRKAA